MQRCVVFVVIIHSFVPIFEACRSFSWEPSVGRKPRLGKTPGIGRGRVYICISHHQQQTRTKTNTRDRKRIPASGIHFVIHHCGKFWDKFLASQGPGDHQFGYHFGSYLASEGAWEGPWDHSGTPLGPEPQNHQNDHFSGPYFGVIF